MTVDERFDRIERSIEELKNSVADLKVTVGDLKVTVAGLSRSLETLTRYVLDFRQETATHFQSMETRLEVLSNAVTTLDKRQPAVTQALVEFGAVHNQIIREQSTLRDSDRNLTFRVEKLEEIVSKLINPAA